MSSLISEILETNKEKIIAAWLETLDIKYSPKQSQIPYFWKLYESRVKANHGLELPDFTLYHETTKKQRFLEIFDDLYSCTMLQQESTYLQRHDISTLDDFCTPEKAMELSKGKLKNIKLGDLITCRFVGGEDQGVKDPINMIWIYDGEKLCRFSGHVIPKFIPINLFETTRFFPICFSFWFDTTGLQMQEEKTMVHGSNYYKFGKYGVHVSRKDETAFQKCLENDKMISADILFRVIRNSRMILSLWFLLI